jgi:hypothetical protein
MMCTVAPCCANRIDIAFPIPLPPPVITTDLLVNLNMLLFLYNLLIGEFTHPVIASLDIPLFAFGGKRGLLIYFIILNAVKYPFMNFIF